MFALSTAWNYDFCFDIERMLSETKEMGFSFIELSHHLSDERLEDVIDSANILGIKVASVHSFCPLPPEPQSDHSTHDHHCLSSVHEEERLRAVQYTKKTIDTAKRVSAQAVVIHAGTVELKENYTIHMMDLFNKGKTGSEEYNVVKQKFLKDREDKKEPYLKAVRKSLKEILPYALEANVKIGLETRYNPEEIPNFEEIKYFLELFKGKGLFYWHDVGHAEVSERLGITPHSAFLDEFSEYMIGMHLHDIKGLEDHRAPFSGDLDFSKIIPYLSDDLINVIEVGCQATCSEIKDSLEKLEALFVGK